MAMKVEWGSWVDAGNVTLGDCYLVSCPEDDSRRLSFRDRTPPTREEPKENRR
jgi:hypothetical protein